MVNPGTRLGENEINLVLLESNFGLSMEQYANHWATAPLVGVGVKHGNNSLMSLWEEVLTMMINGCYRT